MKKTVLLQPPYPYGKSQTYMGGALLAVGSMLIDAGFEVEIIDLNMTEFETALPALKEASLVGITVIGSPYIPGTIELAKKLAGFNVPVAIGGQVISKLGQREFSTLFAGTNAIQIKGNNDLEKLLELSPSSLRDPFTLSFIPMWKKMNEGMLRSYLSTEMTLVFSQGCHFQCAFCAAEKKQRERFKEVDHLCHDLKYLVRKAKEFGLKKLEFYATSLDFFQNPDEVSERLRMIGRVRDEYGINIRVRCLTCLESLIKAYQTIPDFEGHIHKAGLWCVGLGVDGINTWKEQKKFQNKDLTQVWHCLEIADASGFRAETLLVMGFVDEAWWLLPKYLFFVFWVSVRYKGVMLRPYLAKPQVPGNDGWGADDPTRMFVRNPRKFHNVDFCCVGSPETHPNFWFRWCANIIYLSICGIWSPLGKCTTSPLMPQGKSRWWNMFANWWNRIVPFDR